MTDKHAIKQVDRLLNNDGIDSRQLAAQWVPFVVAQRDAVVVNFDRHDLQEGRLQHLQWGLLGQGRTLRRLERVHDRRLR